MLGDRRAGCRRRPTSWKVSRVIANWGEVFGAKGLPTTVIGVDQVVPSKPASFRTGWIPS